MGDWSWVQLKDIADRDEEFGILPIPINNDPRCTQHNVFQHHTKGYSIDQNTVEQQEAGKKFIEFIYFNHMHSKL